MVRFESEDINVVNKRLLRIAKRLFRKAGSQGWLAGLARRAGAPAHSQVHKVQPMAMLYERHEHIVFVANAMSDESIPQDCVPGRSLSTMSRTQLILELHVGNM